MDGAWLNPSPTSFHQLFLNKSHHPKIRWGLCPHTPTISWRLIFLEKRLEQKWLQTSFVMRGDFVPPSIPPILPFCKKGNQKLRLRLSPRGSSILCYSFATLEDFVPQSSPVLLSLSSVGDLRSPPSLRSFFLLKRLVLLVVVRSPLTV